MAVAALVLLAAGAALLVALHLARTGLDPVVDAVSDYGTTERHALYRAMVVALGLSAALLAAALARETDADALIWLWLFAFARIAIAGFMTDRGPRPATREGRIHLLLAGLAFTAIAFAAANVRWAGAPSALDPIGAVVVVAAVGTLLTRAVRPLNRAFGAVERLLYVAFLAWLAVAAASLL